MRTSDQSRRLSQCEGKDKFENFDQALQGVSNKLWHLVRPYHCQVCDKYHVGSIETQRLKRISLAKIKEKKQ